jgi:hypothetical protein
MVEGQKRVLWSRARPADHNVLDRGGVIILEI